MLNMVKRNFQKFLDTASFQLKASPKILNTFHSVPELVALRSGPGRTLLLRAEELYDLATRQNRSSEKNG